MSKSKAIVAACLATAGLLVGSPGRGQDTVTVWLGEELVEARVLQLAALPSSNPAGAQLYLNTNGFGAFRYAGTSYCDYASLFSHPAASSAPILAATQTLDNAETPYFWTFQVENFGLVDSSYLLGGANLPTPEEFEVILDDLDIEASVFTEITPTYSYYYVLTQASSGLEVISDINRLHEELGGGVYFEMFGVLCPSGGGGGGGGPLRVPEIPTLDRLGLALLALTIALAALAVRHKRRRRA